MIVRQAFAVRDEAIVAGSEVGEAESTVVFHDDVLGRLAAVGGLDGEVDVFGGGAGSPDSTEEFRANAEIGGGTFGKARTRTCSSEDGECDGNAKVERKFAVHS